MPAFHTLNRVDPQGTGLLKRLRTVLEMVKIEHTIFALPFAFLGAILAVRDIPSPAQIGWILLAMAAMQIKREILQPDGITFQD